MTSHDLIAKLRAVFLLLFDFHLYAIVSHIAVVSACKSYEVECPNTVCIPRAYICDGFNDCGCVEDCDEQDCEGLGIGK